ncbi:MAG: hypothetical protein ACT6S0_03715 [Roseateles sp.]|uniref:hypothetical protein n=1 Tax=Roseateles sp. TaxID=1971397 RepID=UPI00403701AC
MWEQDWALLGLAPTTELAAIKKAYALKLRVTRPDDDAEAYQALRGAYERVQQWLKWQQQEAASQVSEEAVAAPLLSEPKVEPAAAPVVAIEPLPLPEHVVQPQHLIDELTQRWRHTGEAALLHQWSAVQRELGQQPLSRHVEFSAAFAQWALGTPALPDDFLKALNSHFGWLDDFRTERQLGTPLAEALHETLDARVRPLVLEPALQALAAPLLGLDALRRQGGTWWLRQLIGLLLQPSLAHGHKELGDERLRRIGLDADAQQGLKEAAMHGAWLRVGLATLACMVVAVQTVNDAFIGIGYGLTWLLSTGAIMLFGGFAGTLMLIPAALLPALARWRRHGQHQPALALVWLLFAAWLCYLAAAPDASPGSGALSLLPPWAYGYAAAGFAVAGLLLAWPDNAEHAWVTGGLAPLIGWLAVAALGTWLPMWSCLLIGAAWMLAAGAVHEARLPLPAANPLRWLLRPMLNSLTLMDRWGFTTALMPVAACVAWAVFARGEVDGTRIFLVWVLSILAVGWLQFKADAWCLRLMQAIAPR